jgi:adenylylsulfate kinase
VTTSNAESGAIVWLTGLSGAGKTTIGEALTLRLRTCGRSACLLDGDVLRRGLNRDLGFSPADRHENIRRTAEVARLLAASGTIAIVAVISPYLADRATARHIAGNLPFLEVHVATDLRTCEQRDPKGLYRLARSGQLPGFTGIDAPYEAPTQPDLHLDTACLPVEVAVTAILGLLHVQ